MVGRAVLETPSAVRPQITKRVEAGGKAGKLVALPVPIAGTALAAAIRRPRPFLVRRYADVPPLPVCRVCGRDRSGPGRAA